MASRIQLFSAVQVKRMIRRIAYEIIEKNKDADNLVIIGILKRGAHLADLLGAEVERISSTRVSVHHLDVSAFRDDASRDPVTLTTKSNGIDVSDKDVVLVDDVLYTGRTVRAALDAIVGLGRPAAIQLAVLVDRGHREYPIEPTYAGRRVPTKYGEHVEVVLHEEPSVYLEE